MSNTESNNENNIEKKKSQLLIELDECETESEFYKSLNEEDQQLYKMIITTTSILYNKFAQMGILDLYENNFGLSRSINACIKHVQSLGLTDDDEINDDDKTE